MIFAITPYFRRRRYARRVDATASDDIFQPLFDFTADTDADIIDFSLMLRFRRAPLRLRFHCRQLLRLRTRTSFRAMLHFHYFSIFIAASMNTNNKCRFRQPLMMSPFIFITPYCRHITPLHAAIR